MKMKMNMIVAIMITFCFTATLFLVIPIRSATSPYDPNVDSNHDGKISLADLTKLANSYDTTGDPTLNVTVTNAHPNGWYWFAVNGSDNQRVTLDNGNFTQTGYSNHVQSVNTSITNGFGAGYVPVYIGGNSRMFISIELVAASYQGVPVTTTVTLNTIWWTYDFAAGSAEQTIYPIVVLNATYDGTHLPSYSLQVPPEFKTKNYFCWLTFFVSSGATSGWITYNVYVYLRNE